MAKYVLEKSSAVKVSTGIYRWSFAHQNEIVPDRVTVGPISITTSNDQRNVVIESDTFRKSDRNTVRRGDALKPVLCNVFPHQRFKHEHVQASTAITAAEIEALSSVVIWLDLHDPQYILNEALAAAAVGDSVDRVISRKPSGSLIFFASGDDKVQKVAQENTFGLRQADGSAWSFMLDSSTANNPTLVPSGGVDIYMIKAPTNLNVNEIGILHKQQKWRFYQGGLQYQAHYASWVASNLVFLGGYDYIMIFTEVPAENKKVIRLIKLSDNSEQTEDGTEFDNLGTADTFYISSAQTHMNYTQGSWIHMQNNTEDVEKVVNYFKQIYSEQTAPEPVTSYQLYDPRQTVIRMDKPAEHLKEIVLEFQDQDRTLFDPEDVLIEVSIEPEK